MTVIGTIMCIILIPILVIPIVPILGIAGYLNVKLQKLTGNIWLGGLVNAMLIILIFDLHFF